jgi:hypothetical protein
MTFVEYIFSSLSSRASGEISMEFDAYRKEEISQSLKRSFEMTAILTLKILRGIAAVAPN